MPRAIRHVLRHVTCVVSLLIPGPLLGRDKRKSSKAWSWRETYPMYTPTWQVSTFPRCPHHWRLTPTECVPRLGKLLGSKAMIPSGAPNRSGSSRQGCASYEVKVL